MERADCFIGSIWTPNSRMGSQTNPRTAILVVIGHHKKNPDFVTLSSRQRDGSLGENRRTMHHQFLQEHYALTPP